jgi:membrane-associated phospholipid phosphatase
MEPIWQWGLDLIRTIQSVHGPVLDAVFKVVTFLGEEDFFMILLPLVLWSVDFAVGVRLTFAFLFSAYVNNVLKNMLAHPRPFVRDPTVQLHKSGVEGYGLPSGHSQSSVVVWGFLAHHLRKRWAWIVAILLMVLVGFSRVYLGVHFPTDVLGGWVLGAVILVAYAALCPRIEAWVKRISLVAQLLLVVVPALVLVSIYATDITTSTLGVVMGMGVGFIVVGHWVPYSAAGPLWKRAVRFLLGMAVLLILRYSLKAIFPDVGEPLYLAFRVVRYAAMGLWGGLGAPWVFLRLRLASSG